MTLRAPDKVRGRVSPCPAEKPKHHRCGPLPQPGLAAWLETELGSPQTLIPLAGDGGGRLYFRLEGAGRVALYGPDPAENRAWLNIGRHLAAKDLPVPQIYGHDVAAGFFILEDLGDRFLAEPGADPIYYFSAVEALARFHRTAAEGFDPGWCQRDPVYDRQTAEDQEIGYCLNHLMVGLLNWPEPSARVRGEAGGLAEAAAAAGHRGLIHRDYQGRNLMIQSGRVRIIDWQGARLGPAAYDLAALIQETPAGPLAPAFKEELVGHYLRERPEIIETDTFRQELLIVGTVRLMQALGAYAKLARAGKPKFLAYIEQALAILAQNFRRPPLSSAFPLLRESAEKAWQEALEDPRFL